MRGESFSVCEARTGIGSVGCRALLLVQEPGSLSRVFQSRSSRLICVLWLRLRVVPRGSVQRKKRARIVAGSDAVAAGDECIIAEDGDYLVPGECAASGFERLSEDSCVESQNPGSLPLSSRARFALDEALSGLGGAGQLSEEDRKRQRVAEAREDQALLRAGKVVCARGSQVSAPHAFDVGMLAVRRVAELVDLARKCLLGRASGLISGLAVRRVSDCGTLGLERWR